MDEVTLTNWFTVEYTTTNKMGDAVTVQRRGLVAVVPVVNFAPATVAQAVYSALEQLDLAEHEAAV